MTRKKIILLCAVGVVLIGVGFFKSQLSAQIGVSDPNTAFVITFLNVGQGDSILIQSNSGESLLIDGGPDKTVVYELKEALPLYDKTIETIVLTHPDSDHAAGLMHVLDYYSVGKIITSGLKPSAELSRALAEKIIEKHVPLIAADATKDFSMTSHEGAQMNFDVLYPLSPIIFSHEDANNDSVLIKATFGEHSFLLTGDIEAETEALVAATYKHGELKTEILKLAHHGSKTSSTAAFIDAASPHIAVASLGKNNKFGHPSPSVVADMAARHIPVLRTDIQGRITFTLTKSGGIRVSCSQCT